MDHLSSLDAAFLHLESPETPMHVGSLMVFELPRGHRGDWYEEVKALIARRMHLITVFHRKLAQMPFQIADPVWVEDDDVDLDYHVRHVTLRRPGTMAQLEQLVARLHSTLLDRSRPLWEVYVIDGLQDGRIGYYTKAHHSGIDGKAGVELSKILYDVTPTVREVPPAQRPTRRAATDRLGVGGLLRAGAKDTVSRYASLARSLPTAARAFAGAARIVASRRAPRGTRGLNLGLSPRTRFNVPITNQRSFSTMSLPLDDVKLLGRRVGGTVNTIVMAMCSGAIRRFLAAQDALPAKSIVAAVPVSLRAADDGAANNQVSMIRVDLATDLADDRARFDAIHASSEAAKSVVARLRPVLGFDVPVIASPWLMSGLASVAVRSGLLDRVPLPASVLISNVPGIPVTLYLAGARMLHFFPVSIPYHELGVNITVQSYAGRLEFGVTACRRVLSQEQSHELMGYMRETLEAIRGFEPVATGEPAAAAPATGRKAASGRKARPGGKAATGRKARPEGKAATGRPAAARRAA